MHSCASLHHALIKSTRVMVPLLPVLLNVISRSAGSNLELRNFKIKFSSDLITYSQRSQILIPCGRRGRE